MFCKRETVTITTDSDGAATAYTNVVNGRILSVQYVKPTSGGFADGVDFTITTETTGQSVLAKNDVNASAVICPRRAVHNTGGEAIEYADGYPIFEPVIVSEERIKIAIASGGDGGIGTFHITIG